MRESWGHQLDIYECLAFATGVCSECPDPALCQAEGQCSRTRPPHDPHTAWDEVDDGTL